MSTTTRDERTAAVLADFKSRMTLREADRYLGMATGTVRRAIERGEIRYVTVGQGRYRVTPEALAEYVEKHLTHTKDPLPE